MILHLIEAIGSLSFVTALMTWLVKDVHRSIQPGCDTCLGYGKCADCGRGHKRHHFADLKPTKLDALITA